MWRLDPVLSDKALISHGLITSPSPLLKERELFPSLRRRVRDEVNWNYKLSKF
jgi:hypothetical protein